MKNQYLQLLCIPLGQNPWDEPKNFFCSACLHILESLNPWLHIQHLIELHPTKPINVNKIKKNKKGNVSKLAFIAATKVCSIMPFYKTGIIQKFFVNWLGSIWYQFLRKGIFEQKITIKTSASFYLFDYWCFFALIGTEVKIFLLFWSFLCVAKLHRKQSVIP